MKKILFCFALLIQVVGFAQELGNSVNGSIKLLRANTIPSSSARYFTTDLGKEGFWYYDAADVTSADNTGTILVSSNGKRFKRIFDGYVNIKWFGAIGDGITPASAAIQSAVNYLQGNNGGVLFCPKGRYFIDSAILVTGNSISFLGENAIAYLNGTTFKQGPTTKSIIEVRPLSHDLVGFRCENIEFFGHQGVSIPGNGIYVHTIQGNPYLIDNVTIKDCSFIGFKDNGLLMDATYLYIFKFLISNCFFAAGYNGINFIGAVSQGSVDNCFILNESLGTSIKMTGDFSTSYYPSNISLNMCTIAGSRKINGAALDLSSCAFISINDPHFEDNSGYQMSIKSSKGMNLQGGHTIQTDSSKGIYIGFNSLNEPNSNIRIDCPGWIKISPYNYIELAPPTGTTSNVYLHSIDLRSLKPEDVTGFATNTPFNSIFFPDLGTTTAGTAGSTSSPLKPSLNFLGFAGGNKAQIGAIEQTLNTYSSKLIFSVNDGSSENNLTDVLNLSPSAANFTTSVAGITEATADNSTKLASTAFVKNQGYLTSSSGVTSITGTVNQVIASAGTGAVTFSLPQSIATNSSPTFSGLEILSSTNASTPAPVMTSLQKIRIANPTAGKTVYCSDCVATDSSTGVMQTYNGKQWKNHW